MFRTPDDNAAARDIARSPLAVPRRRQPSRHLDFATWAAAGYSAAWSISPSEGYAFLRCGATVLCAASAHLFGATLGGDPGRRNSILEPIAPGLTEQQIGTLAADPGYREAAGAFGQPAVLVRATLATDFALAFIDKTGAGGWPGEARWEACMNTRWYRSVLLAGIAMAAVTAALGQQAHSPAAGAAPGAPRSRTSPGFGGIHRCRVSSRRHPVPAR